MNYFSLIASFFFVMAGLYMLIHSSGQAFYNAVSVTIFFALCMFTMIWVIWREKRIQKNLENSHSFIQIEGGKKFFYSNKKFYILFTVFILVFGFMGIFSRINPIMNWLCLALSVFGILTVVLRVFRVIGTHYILFDPHAIEIGDKKGSYRIEWDNIAHVYLGDHYSNPCIFIEPVDLESLQNKVRPIDEKNIKRMIKKWTTSTIWAGSPVTILPENYSLDPALLYKLILQCLNDPKSRMLLTPMKNLEER